MSRWGWIRGVVIVSVLVTGVMTGCGDDDGDTTAGGGGDPSDATAPFDRAAVTDADWVIDADASSIELGAGTRPTLSLRDGTAAGTAPCNTYRGTATVGDDGALEITGVAVTLRGCDEPVTAAEDAYLAALEAVDAVAIDVDGNLVLSGPDDLELVFVGYDEAELIVGEWDVVNVARDDAIEGVIDGTAPVLTFGDDGTVTLTTGCNDASSTYELDGVAITIGPARQTRMACAEPPGVMEQEAALVAALEDAATVEVAPGGALTLLTDQGTIALVALPPT